MTLSGLLLVKPPQTGGARKCDLCLTEEMAIMKADPESLLNMREEFVSKCRHINKFTLWFFKKKKLIKYTSSLFSRDLWDIVHISTSIKTIQFKLSTLSAAKQFALRNIWLIKYPRTIKKRSIHSH